MADPTWNDPAAQPLSVVPPDEWGAWLNAAHTEFAMRTKLLREKSVSGLAIVDGALVPTHVDGSTATPLALPTGGTQGVPGWTWRGAYAGATAYAARDAVSYQGRAFYALQATTGTAPPATATSTATWSLIVDKGGDGSASAQAVADALLDDDGPAGEALAAEIGVLKIWAKTPELLVVGAITRHSNGAALGFAVEWPDGLPGTYTADAVSTAFPGSIDGYHITRVAGGTTRTYTQPTITRNSSGAVTNVPQITVA